MNDKQGRVTDYLLHILAAIDRVRRHTRSVDESAFLTDELIRTQ